MTRVLMFFSGLLICYFVYGFYISQINVNVIPLRLKKDNSMEFFDYRGVINVHSELSLGSSSYSKIISSARAAGLDFIFFTDLNLFDIPYNEEGYHGNTLVFSAGKYSYLDSRLIYYSNKGETLGQTLGDSQVRLSDFLSQKRIFNRDEFIVLAHPYKLDFTWSGDIPIGLDGVELINLKSLSYRAWESSKLSVIWSLFTYPFNPKLSLIRLFQEPTEEIGLFDEVSLRQSLNMFAGAEASARAIPIANYLLKFPSYQKSFEIFSNHVLLKSELTGQVGSDKQKIFQAIKNGNFYLAFDFLGETKGFQAFVQDNNKTHLMGSSIRFNKNLILRAEVPAEPSDFYEIVVYRNGVRYATGNSSNINLQIIEPGVYRIQVRVSPFLPLPDAKKWFTWIYTNPFYIN
ncbi:MAG: hypothetical protein AABY64_09955 [Bdellovibrionota bacterium]